MQNELASLRNECDNRRNIIWKKVYADNLVLGSDIAGKNANYAVENDFTFKNLSKEISWLEEKIKNYKPRPTPISPTQHSQSISPPEKSLKSSLFVPPGATAKSLTKRGFQYLESSNWEIASAYFDSALDIDSEHAPAHIGMLCVELLLNEEKALSRQNKPFNDNANFKRALRYADESYKNDLERYVQEFEEHQIEQERLEKERKAEQKRLDRKLKAENKIIEAERKAKQEQFEIELKALIQQRRALYQRVATGAWHTVCVKNNGTVASVGDNSYGQCDTDDWYGIIGVYAGDEYTIGLKTDGTLIATGKNNNHCCAVGGWKDIVEVAAGSNHTIGLKTDGTVLATGLRKFGHCNVDPWRDIIAIAVDANHSYGLKSNGTVVRTGTSNDKEIKQNKSIWKDIIMNTAGGTYTVKKRDGSVPDTVDSTPFNANGMREIIAMFSGGYHSVGLKSDGTLIATGNNRYGQCDVSEQAQAAQKARRVQEKEQKRREEEKRIFEEQRDREERELRWQEELQREQLWEQQGLCKYDGGRFVGLKKKCKICGRRLR